MANNFADGPKQSNPAKKFYKWKSQEKGFFYYDRELGKEVQLQTPSHLIMLEEFSAVTGYASKFKCGLTSNEVSDLLTERLYVKSFKGDFRVEGVWKDIKADLPRGSKFAKNLYCLRLDKANGNEIIHLQLGGGASGEYMDFKFNNFKEILIIKSGAKEAENEGITYNVPLFDKTDLLEGYIEEAQKSAILIKKYFESKKNNTHTPTPDE